MAKSLIKYILLFSWSLLLTNCSPKYHCKRCPQRDSVVMSIDTITIKGDSVTIKGNCMNDTVIIERQGRLEIRTIFKNKYVQVQGKCDSIQKYYVTTTKTVTKTIVKKEVPVWMPTLLFIVCGFALLVVVRSFY